MDSLSWFHRNYTDSCSGNISVHHCCEKKRRNAKRRFGERRFSFLSLFLGIRSRLTNSKRTFCKVDRDSYTKRPGYIHAEIRRARVSHLDPALCRPPHATIFRFRESVIQPLCARSRFSPTWRWASALPENHFTSSPIAYIRYRYNEPPAERNYFALLTRSLQLFQKEREHSCRSRGTVTWTSTWNSAAFCD